MTQEEKAKAYDEAKQRAKHALDCDRNGLVRTDKSLIFSMFPELAESEDEMIREVLIKETKGSEVRLFEAVTNDEFVAWLEKQEQKPNIKMKTPEESLCISPEEYNEFVNNCFYGESKPVLSEEYLIDINAAVDDYFGEDYAEELRGRLKSLKERAQPQPKQEVDLEKELIGWHKEHFKKYGTFIGMSGFYLTNNSQMDIAKHFFVLGLKHRKDNML